MKDCWAQFIWKQYTILVAPQSKNICSFTWTLKKSVLFDSNSPKMLMFFDMNSEKAFVIYLSVLVYLNCVKYV